LRGKLQRARASASRRCRASADGIAARWRNRDVHRLAMIHTA